MLKTTMTTDDDTFLKGTTMTRGQEMQVVVVVSDAWRV